MKKILLVFAMCAAFVGCQDVAQPGDYVDEYGVNHGQGIKIGETVWAPVNCGYHSDYYKYGKLYQWGRKYGQGYDGSLFNADGDVIRKYSDAFVPKLVAGPVSLAEGQSESNSQKFYYGSSGNIDWLNVPDDKLWNIGTEKNPIKTKYDPCPEGWRVPTDAELRELIKNHSPWTTDKKGLFGYWCSGPEPYSEVAPRVFLPAAGSRGASGSDWYCGSYKRGCRGMYWSSNLSPLGKWGHYYHLSFSSYGIGMSNDFCGRAYGYSVRCVQE